MRALPRTAFALLLTLPLLASQTTADMLVIFTEGAPKDRFTLLNTDPCAITEASVLIDISTARGKLIFDVTDQGAGVQVFQPFEIVTGADALAGLPEVLDGQSALRLNIVSLAAGAEIAFTIDVDDTLGQRETTVSGSEIDGATLALTRGADSLTAGFSQDARATLLFSGCTS